MDCQKCGSKMRQAEVDGERAYVCIRCNGFFKNHESPKRQTNCTEEEMHMQIVQAISCLEAKYTDLKWIHHSPSEVSSPARAVKMKKMGTRAGVMDLEWCLVREVTEGFGETKVYNGLAIELKAGKNNLTPSQKERKEWLERQGWKVLVCRSAQEAVDAILQYYGTDKTSIGTRHLRIKEPRVKVTKPL